MKKMAASADENIGHHCVKVSWCRDRTAMRGILVMLLLMCCISSVKAQQPAGKSYKALVGETCKDMDDEGCMLYTYRVMDFRKDSVVVRYVVEAFCGDESMEERYEHIYDKMTRSYRWRLSRNEVKIEGLDDYGKLVIYPSKIVAEKGLEFLEERKP